MKQWLAVLAPSVYGLFFMVLITVGLMTALGLPNVLERSGIGEYVSLFKKGEAHSALYTSYQEINNQVNDSKFAADSSVFMFWATVGLIAYAGVLALKHVYDEAQEFVEVTGSAKWGRKELWLEAGKRLAIRLIAIALLYGWTVFLLRVMLPVLAVNMTVMADFDWLSGAVRAITLFVIILVSLHITVVLLRILMLRTRLFMKHAVLHGGH